MSTSAALATVTATLSHLLQNLASTVTTHHPSNARNGSEDQINIYLYSTQLNTALSNTYRVHEGTHNPASAPLPLVLKYLITSYGSSDNELNAQQILGSVMQLLHDNPLITASDIQGNAPDSSLHLQREKLRITLDPLSLDDVSKLWSSFQSTPFRLSASYEVSVVLIDSANPIDAPLPVLTRGAQDRGIELVIDQLPIIQEMRFPHRKPAAELGDTVALQCSQTNHANATIHLNHPLLTDAIELSLTPTSSPGTLQFDLPIPSSEPALVSQWVIGYYQLSLIQTSGASTPLASNQLSMPLAPKITNVSPTTANSGDVLLMIACQPQIRVGQSVSLLFNNQTYSATSMTNTGPAADTLLSFALQDVPAKTSPYVVRIRVDGIDSNAIDFSAQPPRFDAAQQVLIS